MPNSAENNKRIAKNTLLLYVRMLFLMCVSLFTSRVVLNTLGVTDYGIYNVVGGVVAMFGFINGSMASATQRYITFALGKGDMANLAKVFSTALQIHFLIAALVIVLGETVGLWFMYTQMQIPAGRMDAAFWVLQCSIVSTAIMIISVPYNADIIAHEKMSAFAYLTIGDAVLKLSSVFILTVLPYDKLILYAFFILCIQFFDFILYIIYCTRHFEECRLRRMVFDREMFREIFSYAGWTMNGYLAVFGFTQGLNILLNIFFNPAVNAARGIACTINNVLMQFFNNFYMAVRPQIIKYYAQGDTSKMLDLVFKSTKYSFFLCFIFSLPVMIETPFLIRLWLGQIPEYTVAFTRLIIIISIVDALAAPTMTAAHATGKIRLYQFVVGTILILNIPISYCFLKYIFHDAVTVYIISLVLAITAFIVRLYIVKRLVSFSIRLYMKTIILKILALAALSAVLPLCLHAILEQNFISSATVIAASVISTCSVIYLLGLNRTEKAVVTKAVRNKIKAVWN